MVTSILEEEFRQIIEQRRVANNAFVNRNAQPLKEMASHRADVTVLGAFGGFEHGWVEVGSRYDWAAARFNGGAFTSEIIATYVTSELAYSVAIERSAVRFTGSDEPAQQVLRVTKIFRREDGAWRLMHRHADPLVSKQGP
ncbi:MAG: nuclear transport factor 2 family protein [Chloroflexota bacterium]|nr:nuclear transport factor 2 family protein [Chloroflexota bacterium]